MGVENLFTSALGLVPPWQVEKVELGVLRWLQTVALPRLAPQERSRLSNCCARWSGIRMRCRHSLPGCCAR